MKNTNQALFTQSTLILCCALLLGACGTTAQNAALLDKDNDTVTDALDECPMTVPGSPVDLAGCSLFRGKIEAVEFGPGDHRLNASSRESLANLVTLINAHPQVVLQLGGHTDNRGSARENLALSKRRVMSVVRYLVANGVAAERLKPTGYGESRPVVSNATESGRAQNRRIEMSVFTQ